MPPHQTNHGDHREGLVHARIHNDFANYAFADGHVKALRFVRRQPNENFTGGCPAAEDWLCDGPPKAGIDWNGDGVDRTDGLYN